MDVLGIDISKDDFHACLLQVGRQRAHSFPNNHSGYRQLSRWLKNRGASEIHACMEATGPYWRGLATSLFENGVRVSVVNPARTAMFARSQLRRTKTDTRSTRR
jgi:transposase